MSLPLRVRYYGEDKPLPEQTPLRAGPLHLIYEAGDLRYIRLGDQEIVRRIYVAVRDQNWGTAPVALSDVQMEIADDHFAIHYTVENRMNEIDFIWQGTITGERDGTIRFSMDGQARSTFLRNRLGFCVLHPLECAGRPARIEHVDGTVEQSAFPVQIAPQLVIDGQIKPVAPFAEMAALAYEVKPGVWAELRFEGDIFEMEDQRNWTDASYKTYCTPLRLPFPVQVEAGTTVRQAVTLRLEGAPAEAAGRVEAAEELAPVLVLEDSPSRPLPRIGLGLASHDQPLTPQAIDRLKRLRPAHLRADLWLGDPAMAATLQRASEQAQALGTALELALFLPDDANRPAEPALRELAELVEKLQSPVWAWLVFNGKTRISDDAGVALARRILGPLLPEARFGGGTDLFFTELNRSRAARGAIPAGLDFICYSINPQVHAFDNSSLVETVVAQAATVESALAFSDGLPVAVTPVTLRMRSNPNATGPEPPPPPGELPPQVDPRQMSLFGAGWTLGSLKYLILSGAHSLTYYETTGWRGVMETEAGSPLPAKFPSLPGAVFPLYHVLADVAEFAARQAPEAAGAASNLPLVVDGFSLLAGERRRTLVANLSPEPQTVVVRNLPAAQTETVQVTVLDEETMIEAMTEPESFRTRPPQGLPLENGVLRLSLKPYAVARIDAG